MMENSGILTRFIEMFIDIYNIFVPADFPLHDYFVSVIVLVVITVSIVGSLLFAAITINAMFSVLRSK